MSWYKAVLEKLKTIKHWKGLQDLQEEQGAIFVLTAILLPVIIGVMGFGYDVGNLYMHKARLQNAADAASLEGARAFVDEAASQRKTLRTQYMNNNNVTSIPIDVSAEINETVKTEAKTAAKSAAVANVAKNMVNLHNDYQSKYYLVTGRVTESGKNYEQQYFKANLKETVPLFFIPILLNLKEQEVAAEAISTIINKGTGSGGNNSQRKKFGPDSLFMVKEAIYADGNSFYDNGDTPKTDDQPKAPTWTGYMDGNLRYTGSNVPTVLDSNQNRYDGKQYFDRVFNSKALSLMTKVKEFQSGFSQEKYDAFLAEFVTHPDFCSNAETHEYTTKGQNLLSKVDILRNPDIEYTRAYWAAYNAFYDELSTNANYYRTFEKLEGYDMDLFGESIKSLFKTKLAAEQGISEATYIAQWQAAHDAWVTTTSDGGEWKTEHDNWQANHDAWATAEAAAIADAQAQIDQIVANGGGEGSSVVDPYNCTPQQAYEILKKYKDMYPAKSAIINGRSGNDYAWDEYCNAGDNQYFNLSKDTFINYVQNIVYNASYSQWEDVPTDWSDWLYMGLRQGYEAYKANGGTTNLTPKDAYDKLVVYKDFINKDANTLCTLLVMDEYKKDGSPYGIIYDWDFTNKVKNMPDLNENSLTWAKIGDYNDSDFKNVENKDWWNSLKNMYTQGNGNLDPSSSSIPTLSQLMAPWYAEHEEPAEPTMPREPQKSDFIPSSNGDEYYAQYNGQQGDWLASEISAVPPSKEHKYFYYNNAPNFTLYVDRFYEDGTTVTSDDPFYLYIGDNFKGDIIKIELQADMNRPLVFCYIGSKDNFTNPKIYVNLNGHTFKGIIYTPNSEGYQNIYLQNGGSFRGTWMSKSLGWQDAKTGYAYEEYYLDPSLEKAMPDYDPTQQGDYSGDDDITDEDLSDKNPIKVIKLVKKVENVLSEEQID